MQLDMIKPGKGCKITNAKRERESTNTAVDFEMGIAFLLFVLQYQGFNITIYHTQRWGT
jgi:hypothetical protein